MKTSVIVLGAGMVGTCTALHLQSRGHTVTLVDRRAPGQETSHGNAGLIQRESVQPYAFPRELPFLLDVALGRGAEVNWHARALPRMAGALWSYFRNSSPVGHARATTAYSRLIAHATQEHQPLITAAGAEDLVTRNGFRFVFRTPAAFQEATERARMLESEYGVRHQCLDSAALRRDEPALRPGLVGAVHWLDPWAVSDPGGLVQRYADLFVQRGGQLVHGDAQTLQQQASGWQVQTDTGTLQAAQAVVALGPWSDDFVQRWGYRLPLFIKRGYHQHYAAPVTLRMPVLDAEKGYVLAPMRQGLRLTTGAEFADIDAPPTPVQLGRAESLARELVDLGEPVPQAPWLGARPCTADMLPVMGPAPQHKGLWFNFGHAHQGFTLGPVAGRLLAEMVEGERTWIDPRPYLPARFA
jgi:D-amino-acid dehydrogenase